MGDGAAAGVAARSAMVAARAETGVDDGRAPKVTVALAAAPYVARERARDARECSPSALDPPPAGVPRERGACRASEPSASAMAARLSRSSAPRPVSRLRVARRDDCGVSSTERVGGSSSVGTGAAAMAAALAAASAASSAASAMRTPSCAASMAAAATAAAAEAATASASASTAAATSTSAASASASASAAAASASACTASASKARSRWIAISRSRWRPRKSWTCVIHAFLR